MARVIAFEYTLTDAAGKTLDSSSGRGPLAFIEGSGQIIPGLEKELVTLSIGSKKQIKVSAADAYGLKDEELVIKVPKASLPVPQVKVGDRFRGGADDHSPVFVVIDIKEDEITLDGNHPLAGQDLTFAVEMKEIREATAEEMQHGHAHGEHGHHH